MGRKFYNLLEVKYKLRPRQEEALPLIENDDDITVVLPTGAGKTLIGVIAMAKELNRNRRSVWLSPLKALTAEQSVTFQNYFPDKRIILDDGDNRKDMEQYGDWDIAELTYERFASLLTREKSRNVFNNLGLIVVDEIHNIGDEDRGSTLDSAIMEIRILFPKVKIIGLSATIDEAKKFASELNTKLILAKKSERPVPLRLSVVSYKDHWNSRLNLLARVDMVKAILKRHPNKTMLIFTTSRARTKQVIEALAGRKNITVTEALFNHKMCWHNAGLSVEDRKKIERLFRQGKIKVIACTPTLAAGVNLPADICVMFDMFQWTFLKGKSIIKKNRLNQTIGRAGRPGLSKMGYAYIFATYRQKQEVIEHLKKPVIVKSQLKKDLKSKVLRWITAKIFVDEEKLQLLMKFFIDKTITVDLINETLDWLQEKRFIKIIEDNHINAYISTFKGRMTTFLMIQPETVLHWEKVLYKKENLTNAELFCLIASAPEYAGIVVPYDHDDTKIAYAKQYIGDNPEVLKHFRIFYECHGWYDYAGQIYKIFALTYNKELILVETKEYRRIIDEIESKIEGRTEYREGMDQSEYWNVSEYRKKISDIEREFSMSYGDRYTVKKASMRYLNAASILCQNFKDQLTELMIGAQHSIISGGIIELSRLKGIGDVRLKLLLNSGINSVERLLSTSNKKLSEILKLKEESIMKLKKSTAMFL